MLERDPAILAEIEAYNREDCIGTRVLADWLLERRAEALDAVRRVPAAGAAGVEAGAAREGRASRAARGAARNGRREPCSRPSCSTTTTASASRSSGRSSTGGHDARGAARGPRGDRRARAYTGASRAGEEVDRVHVHVSRRRSRSSAGQRPDRPGDAPRRRRAVQLDRDARELELKRGPKLDEVPLPEALFPGGPYARRRRRQRSSASARSLLARDGRYPAIESVLRREPFDRDVQTNDIEQMTELAPLARRPPPRDPGPAGLGQDLDLGSPDRAALSTPARRSASPRRATRRSTSCSRRSSRRAAELGIAFRGLKKASGSNPESQYDGDAIENVFDNGDCARLRAARRHGLALLRRRPRQHARLPVHRRGRPGLARRRARDGHLRAQPRPRRRSAAARPGAAGHAPGRERARRCSSTCSAAQPTIPPDRGLFLERTYRLHPDVCDYISEEFYEGRLQPDPVTSTRTTPFGTGSALARRSSTRATGRSRPEEASSGAGRGRAARGGGRRPRRDQGRGAVQRSGRPPPRRAARGGRGRHRRQVPGPAGAASSSTRWRARAARTSRAASSSSSPATASTSRSRGRECLAYLVCSPRLLEVDCRTIEHMRLANALCRFVELAQAVSRTAPPWAALSSLRDRTPANQPICSDF